MKIKAMSLLAISLILCSIIISKEQGQSTGWKGRIEVEDGIKVIRNPGEPLYGEITFELEEDLSIGKEDDENYVFHGVVTLAVDSEENIYVLDGGNCRIQKFDKYGNYLLSMGRKGQGPGEFEQPNRINVDLEDSIYVFDSYRRNLHVFEKEGEFKKTIKLTISQFFGLAIGEKGNMLTHTTIYSPEESTSDIVLINPKGNVIKTIVSYPLELSPRIKNRILGNPYSHNLYFYPALDGGGVYGHSSEYKLNVLTTTGDTGLIIEKDEKPEPVTQSDKNRQIDGYLQRQKQRKRKDPLSRSEVNKAYIFPKFKPFFSGILLDNENRIYVKRLKLFNPEDGSEVYDLFSENGYYIYKIKMPLSPSLIKNGCIYRIDVEQDTGFIIVKKFKTVNWDQIKVGVS